MPRESGALYPTLGNADRNARGGSVLA